MGEKMSGTLPLNINAAQLQRAIEKGFGSADEQKPIGTRAVVVVYDGKLIAEKYAAGFTKNTRLTGWSMTKSITNALIGILVKQNKLQIDAPAPVPDWAAINDVRHAITLKNLLQQTSGLDFEEEYRQSSDATTMLFRSADMAGYAASRPLKHTPGSVFYYSSGNTNILSRIILQTVVNKDYYAFSYR